MPNPIHALLAAAAAIAGFGPAQADAPTRSAAMPFSDCLALMQEVADEFGPDAMTVARTRDVHSATIRAADGDVILVCSRTDQTVTLMRTPSGREARLGSAPRP